VNNELARMWKEGVVMYFEVLYHQWPERTGKPRETWSQDGYCLGQDQNLGPPDYKAGVIITAQFIHSDNKQLSL